MFLDIGIGILTALFLGGTEASWVFIFAGILFALLPDVDYILLSIFKKI